MNKLYEETSIQDIANAIREKNGSTDRYTVGEMGNAIREIESGGGDIDALIDGSITEIKSNATSVRGYAFRICSNLTTVNFSLATSIGQYAFNGCSKLTTINLPKVMSIGSASFQTCNNMTKIVIGTAHTSVCVLSAQSAFYPSSVSEGKGFIYVPDNLVESYKTATNWSRFSNQIKGISELAT